MKYMYQLSTNGIFCSETELKYDSIGKSLQVNGLFSVTGDPNKFKKVENFSVYADKIICFWQED